jgi:hypothetical protein
MTVQSLCDLSTPIDRVLKTAGWEGVLLESEGQGRYAYSRSIPWGEYRTGGARAETRRIGYHWRYGPGR